MNKWIYRECIMERDRQMNRQNDKQIETQIDEQIDKYKKID